MTLKEQFENLLGRPIPVRPKLEDIPCIETSDPERLCKHPVVSVRMTTYNHAPYIRQAVESVMMQETDFEYELIIGEDASPDNTREICFELQKKYPDRIRVLWSEENVYKMSGSFRRVDGRCRGEFLAFLEGDDYWMDPHRLQKQVDVMRQHPNVVLCFGEQQNLEQTTGVIVENGAFRRRWPVPGVISGGCFSETDCLAPPFTSLVRTSAMRVAEERFEIFDWGLSVGDHQIPRALCQYGDIYVFHDVFATYRNHIGGVTKRLPHTISMAAGVVRMYFAIRAEKISRVGFLVGLRSIVRNRLLEISLDPSVAHRRVLLSEMLQHEFNRLACEVFVGVIGVWLVRLGCHKILQLYFRVVDKMRRVLV